MNILCFIKISIQNSTKKLSLISLSKFNLPLIGTFTWPTPPGPYRATTCRGEGIKLWITYILFWPHMEGLLVSAQCRCHLRDNTKMKDNTHQAHTQTSQQGECGMMITTAKWFSGTVGGLKFPDICLTGEEKPRKNLTQETCPDRGSNPGPLLDRRACYHLLHSGGQQVK